MENAIQRAVRVAGGLTALAGMLSKIRKVSPQAVHQWVENGQPPAAWCVSIERAVDRIVTRYELRPDIFGDPPIDHRIRHRMPGFTVILLNISPQKSWLEKSATRHIVRVGTAMASS